MTIVDFNTCIWKDPWFRKLPLKAKVLFVFLWTNDHKNLACLYEIDMETMSFYTGLPSKDIKNIIETLSPKVKYDFDSEVVWVTNFVRHQFMRTKNISSKIIKGIEVSLLQLKDHVFVENFIKEYHILNIKIQYPIERVSRGYPYLPGGGGGEGEGKGKGKGEDRGIVRGKEEEAIFRKQALDILSYLNKTTGKNYTQTTEIQDRLKEGRSVADCKKIIINKSKDPWFVENPKYMHVSTLFRKSNWDKYINYTPNPLQGVVSEKTMRTIENLENLKLD